MPETRDAFQLGKLVRKPGRKGGQAPFYPITLGEKVRILPDDLRRDFGMIQDLGLCLLKVIVDRSTNWWNENVGDVLNPVEN